MKNLIRIIATFFYIGEIPVAPGTMASAAGALIGIAVCGNLVAYLAILAVVLAAGFLTSGRMEKILDDEDPSCVVIDEVAGVMIAFFMLPLHLPVLLVAFFLFRAFDMFKVYPANRIEKIGGSLGIMGDDIVAGLYANILMQVVIRVIHI